MRRVLLSLLLVLACSAELGCAASNAEATEPVTAETAHASTAEHDEPPPSSVPPAEEPDVLEPSPQTSPERGDEPLAEAEPAGKRETRTQEVIGDTVLKNRQNVRDCYEIARQDEPTLQGTLTVHFEIDPKGRVSVAKLNEERSTLKDPSLVTCALDAFKTIRFPPSSRGYESVGNYPFDFRP